ncbi:MAG TPA: hypothetical protein VGF98_02010 [Candidatus Tumulicola sp.]|jgi:hypothetical protein
MAVTYKPGDIVPQDGQVKCTQHPEIEDNVTGGTRFAPCHHFGEEASAKGCTWQYA